MTDQDLVEEDYPRMDSNDTLSRAFTLLENRDLIFIENGKDLAGVVFEKDLLRTKNSPGTKMKRLTVHPPVLEKDWETGDAARLMVENEINMIPIVDKKRVKGVVDGNRILEKAVKGKFGKEPVSKFMSAPVKTIGPDERISKAESMLKENSISRLPVTDETGLVGIITVKDLINNIYHPEHRPRGAEHGGDMNKYGDSIGEKKEYLKMPVKGLMTEILKTMPPETSVKEVVHSMLENNLRGMLIGNGKELQGIVTKRDLLKPVAEYLRPGNFQIQFAGELERLKDFSREEAIGEILEHLGMHEYYLKLSEVYVFLKGHTETMRGERKIYCEIRVTSPRGKFVATDEGWGYKHAMRNTLEAVEKQIRRGKRDHW